MKYNYALLLDNLYPNEQNQKLIQYLSMNQQYNITIFLLSKENMMPNILPVFSIADYFNFNGISIITDEATLEKTIKYPAKGIRIIAGFKYNDFLSVDRFDLQLIEEIIDGYSKKISAGN